MSYIFASLSKQLDGFHTHWDEYLPFAQFVYNTSPSLDSTEYSPAFLVYGRHLHTPLDHVIPVPDKCPKSAQEFVSELVPLLDAARVEVEQTLKNQKGSHAKSVCKKGPKLYISGGRHCIFTFPSIGTGPIKETGQNLAWSLLCGTKTVKCTCKVAFC